ncbi:RimK family alpha-L-glutamate ligase [Candidatus Bathyarchaeota archaeon]|nr:RimK family alpha-L-glutamate ligase [Candidatus Bathyarchaeota archaeon]
MKVGIIASDRKEWHVQRLSAALESRGAETHMLPATRFHSRISAQPRVSVRGYPVDDYDAVIVRRVPGGTPEQVFYRMDVLHRLEDMGVRVINPSEAIERAVDKYYTSTLLEDAGIRTPRTVVTERFGEAMEAFRELGGDVVVKPIFGSLGEGMTRIGDEEIAYRVFRALERMGSVFYVQEFIPHGGEDIRAFVVGEEVVASMRRRSEGWKTNISAGGRAEPHVLEEELVDLSLDASKAIGLEYTGVDLLRSEEDGWVYVVELNSTPGWQGLQTVTETDIAMRIVDYVLGSS